MSPCDIAWHCRVQMFALHLSGLTGQGVGVQVLALAHLMGAPLQDQANFLMRRALLCKANGQPCAAFANCLHAAQVLPALCLPPAVVDRYMCSLRRCAWLLPELNSAQTCFLFRQSQHQAVC